VLQSLQMVMFIHGVSKSIEVLIHSFGFRVIIQLLTFDYLLLRQAMASVGSSHTETSGRKFLPSR
jgi:hypothetical protein